MVKHIKKIAMGLAALIALALGGTALAQAGGTTAKPTSPPAETSIKGEEPGTETAEQEEGAQEKPETGEEPGSEVADDDGPGGHADEPANPNADHEFEGAE